MKHTSSTPAGVPRSRSKFTRRARAEFRVYADLSPGETIEQYLSEGRRLAAIEDGGAALKRAEENFYEAIRGRVLYLKIKSGEDITTIVVPKEPAE